MKLLLSSCLVLLLTITCFGQTVYISGYVNARHMDSISDFVYTLFQQKDAKKIKLQFVDYSSKKGNEEPLTISLKKKMKHSVELDKLFNKNIEMANDNTAIPFKSKRLVNLHNEVRIKNAVKNLAILDKCGVLSSENEVKSVIASSIPELLSVNAKAKVYLLSFYEPSLTLSNVSMDGQSIDDVTAEILTTNVKGFLSGRISTINSIIQSVVLYVNGKVYDVPVTAGQNELVVKKQLNLSNGQLNSVKMVVVYANNKRFEQLLNIRILDENQVTWLNPKPDAGVLVTCLDSDDKDGIKPLLVFNFKTELPITNLVMHIDETTEGFFKSEFRVSDYVQDIWNESSDMKKICLKLDATRAMRSLGHNGSYFFCQYTDQGYEFDLYFTYGQEGQDQFQVSRKLTKIGIIDNGIDINTNDDIDDGRPICLKCE